MASRGGAEALPALPPSPNWFCPTAVATSGSTVAYAAGTKVVHLEGKCLVDTHVFPKRVTAICWLHGVKDTVAVGLDDGVVGTFVLFARCGRTGEAATFQKGHKHAGAVAALACGVADPTAQLELETSHLTDTVVSVDKRGRLCRWLPLANVKRAIQPAKEDAVSVATAGSLAAIGYKGGAVAVVSFSGVTPTVSHWLRGHSLEVQCVSFAPGHDHVLCTSARDKTLRLWDTNIGTELHSWGLPAPPRRGRNNRDGAREKLWLAHCFVPTSTNEPREQGLQLISTTHQGDLLRWNIDIRLWKAVEEPSRFPTSGRAQAVFQICWNNAAEDRLVTISSDRQVVCWNRRSMTEQWNLSTVGGHVYSMCCGGADPDAIALGCGDNLIRVWNCDDGACRTLWKGISARVTSVRWHPLREGLLGFGLEDGTVGIYDLAKDKCQELSSMTRRPVVACRWGPPRPNGNDQFVSLAADGSATLHSTEQELKHRPILDALGPTRPAEFAKSRMVSFDWQLSEPHILAFGMANGGVELVCDSFSHLAILFSHEKSVTAIAWNPRQTNLVASGSDDGTIFIHDTEYLVPTRVKPTGGRDRSRRLDHSGQITYLAWCAHDPTLLLSTSNDGVARVWSIDDGSMLSTLRGHSSSALCCVWSASEVDLVITGGVDHSARMWRWREHPQENTSVPALVSAKKVPKSVSANKTSENSESQQRARQKRPKSVLPRSREWKQQTTTTRQEACLQVGAAIFSGEVEEDKVSFDLGLFVLGPRTEQSITDELNDHRENGRHESAATIDLWRGNLLRVLTQACEERKLTDALVAMSPHAGMDVWLQVVQRYGEQLEDAGDAPGAATQFLLCGEVEKAIQVYTQSHMYPEAVALASTRLSTVPNALYRSWAEYSEMHSDFEQAAKCYLALGDKDKAVQALVLRRGRHSIRAALQLAQKIGAPTATLIPQYVFECRREEDFEAGILATTGLPEYAPLLAALIHEQTIKATESIQPDSSRTEWPHRVQTSILATWTAKGIELAQLSDFQPLPSRPCSMVFQGPIDRCMILHAVGLVRHSAGDPESTLTHWCDALAVAYSNDLFSLLHFLSLIMFPDGDLSMFTPAASEEHLLSVQAWLSLMATYINVVNFDKPFGETSFANDSAAYQHYCSTLPRDLDAAKAVSVFESCVQPTSRAPPADAARLLAAYQGANNAENKRAVPQPPESRELSTPP
eukprot:m.210824 g.210824  ORF g.210824 m.210824 type:complete len:1209 (-) comp15489_c0_seq1:38-3664(-)